jgi:hypothetical protein
VTRLYRALLFLCLVSLPSMADPNSIRISLIQDPAASAPARHGFDKLKAALTARSIPYEEVSSLAAAKGQTLIVAGLPSNGGPAANRLQDLHITMPSRPESLLIRRTTWNGKPLLLLSGADPRGLMYSLLEVAERIGWVASPANPLSEVRDTVESPLVADRGVSIFTMQQAQFEDRLHDENYWARYFDTLAKDRFNRFQVLFAYEMGGYMCPAYPYFGDTPGFADVKVAGLSKETQQRNAADLHRLIRRAHDRGIQVSLGFWCHLYQTSSSNWQESKGVAGSTAPAEGIVTGLSLDNFVPYTRAALAQFLRSFPEVDLVQFLLNPESGLRTQDAEDFSKNVYEAMREAAPNIQYEIRAKGVSNDLIEEGQRMGLKIRVNTKYWAEEVGLPYHPTHIPELNQFERRHGYADMLRYPQEYPVHWTLWTSGTTRILLWGDPAYAKRFAGTLNLGGEGGFDIIEPLGTKMAGHPQLMKPFDLLAPQYRYYDYEFERYWHFFQVFGRLSYNPNTSSEEWDHEFEKRFGREAAPYVEQGLHRASEILPHIVAYCLSALRFSTTRGWPERQRQEDLDVYSQTEPSDTAQFESISDAANDIVHGGESARITPAETSRWFAETSKDVFRLAALAEQHAGAHPGKELVSTVVDLRILANLAAYHAHRIPAGLSLALFRQTHDLNALDDAISNEKLAIQSWEGIVNAAGDVYNSDLMMGLPEYDLSGSWKDELVKLKSGLAALEQERSAYRPEPARIVGKYDLGTGPVLPGFERFPVKGKTGNLERVSRNLLVLDVPDGRYQVRIGIRDEKKSHGPMWIELNGVAYSDLFTVPAGQTVEKTLETSSVDGKLKILFDRATSADWYASTMVVTRVDPVIAHVPVRRMSPGRDLVLKASVSGVASVSSVRVRYGDAHRGWASADFACGEQLCRAVIPAAKITNGMSYFIEASDASGRVATYPEEGRLHPISLQITTDDTPPLLHHTPVITAEALQPLRIVAHVDDASGVKWVRLRYRGMSQHQDFQTIEMLPTGRADEYEVTIPGEDVDAHFDLMYFFEVMDNAGNGKIYPDIAKETPYVIVRIAQTAARANGASASVPSEGK